MTKKVITITILLVTVIFLLTGCINKEKEAKLVITEGEDIHTITKMEGATGATVYYFKEGS